MACPGKCFLRYVTMDCSDRRSAPVTMSTSPLYEISTGRVNSASKMLPASRAASTDASRNEFLVTYYMPAVGVFPAGCEPAPELFLRPAGVVSLAAADRVFPCNAHFNLPVYAGRRARLRVKAEAILGSQFTIDLVEHRPQL